MTEVIVDLVLLSLLGATAIAILRTKNLFAAAMLSGIYSLVSACIFVVLDAVDVAFTEAAVGAGIATILMLGSLALTGHDHAVARTTSLLPTLVVLVTSGVLIYGTLDMPRFGDANAPIHLHVAPHYLELSGAEIGVPNVVTSVLASYRGYDTLGEVTVIFTASVAVVALIGRRRRKLDKEIS
ncbi:MAG: DUF4040 domain-containing protein [Gammaproteobacteria bacterium]|nr:DUF4040 domain-containing protein [Gammaproteobacteria bacterium]